MDDTRGKVRAVITRRFGIDAGLLTDATTLDDLGADSLAIAELIAELEKTFQATMPDADLAEVETVGDIIAFVEESRRR